MKEKKKLMQFMAEQLKIKSPTLPYPESFVKLKYNEKTANGLTMLIKIYIEAHGGEAERVSVTGRAIDNSKTVKDIFGHSRRIGSVTYIPSTMTIGSADLHATINGRSVKIEVKIGKDRQSEAQKRYQESIVKAKGTYLIATSFDQIVQELEIIFKMPSL